MDQEHPSTQTKTMSSVGTKLMVATLALFMANGLAFAMLPAAGKFQKQQSEKRMEQQKARKVAASKIAMTYGSDSCDDVGEISGVPCTKQFTNTYVQCHDGATLTSDTCQPYPVARNEAVAFCEGRCSDRSGKTKCGVNTFSLGSQCEAEFKNVTVTCTDGTTHTLEATEGTCAPAVSYEELAAEACGCGDMPTCFDSDGGQNIFEQGTASGTPFYEEGAAILADMGYTDRCFSTSSYHSVTELYCTSSGHVNMRSIECPTDHICTDGACVLVEPPELLPIILIGDSPGESLSYGDNTIGEFQLVNPNTFDAELKEIDVRFSIGNEWDEGTLSAIMASTSPFGLVLRDEDMDIIDEVSVSPSDMEVIPGGTLVYETTFTFEEGGSGRYLDSLEIESFDLEVVIHPPILNLGADAGTMVGMTIEELRWENSDTAEESTGLDGYVVFVAYDYD